MSHENRITVFLKRLKEAYDKDEIYVSIVCEINFRSTKFKHVFIFKCLVGKVLIAVNPYKQIQDLYAAENVLKYRNDVVENLPAHIYLLGK